MIAGTRDDAVHWLRCGARPVPAGRDALVARHHVWMFTGLPPLKAIQDTKALGVSLRTCTFTSALPTFDRHEAANVSLQGRSPKTMRC